MMFPNINVNGYTPLNTVERNFGTKGACYPFIKSNEGDKKHDIVYARFSYGEGCDGWVFLYRFKIKYKPNCVGAK